MRKILVFIAFLIFPSLSYGEVDSNDLNDIRKLMIEGKYQQALEKHIWFHEESKTSVGMTAVRLSYAIDDWVSLGNKYPPAMDALIRIRDENKEIILSGQGSFQIFHELSSINDSIEDRDDTFKIFMILDDKYPEQAKRYYHVVESLLIEKKAYDICAKYIGDPIYKYEGLRYSREGNLSLARRKPDIGDPSFIRFTDKNFVDEVLSIIEVLIAIEREEDAREVQKRALAYFDNEKIKHAIK